jgi:tetratricopeptide (TPR) repeat protein
MQKLTFKGGLMFLTILISLIILASCSEKKEEGKIEVTTMSSEAKNEFIQGRDLFEKLQQRESLQYFEKAIAEDNNFAMAYYYHSLANPTAKGFFEDLDNAMAYADKASEGERLMILALKAGVDGNQKLQEEYLKELVKLYPEDERAQAQLGQFYFGQQKYDLAVQYLKRSTELNPQYSSSYNMLGYSNRNLENYDEAESAFKKYVELIPDDPNPYDSYAEMLSKQGRYEEAITQYEKALEIDPNFFPSHMGISNNLIYLNRYDEAKMNCDKSFELAKNDGERRFALFTKTVAFVDEGDFDGAMDEMQKQYDIAKNIGDAAAMTGDLNTMGNILFEAGRYDEASTKYNEALQVMESSDLAEEVKENTRRLNVYNNGRVALMNGNIGDAKIMAEEFESRANGANNTFQIWLGHYLNGLIALEENNYQMAISEFEMANLQNPQTYYYLAVACSEAGDNVKAEMYADKCANFNALINLNQAFVRNQANEMLTNM